MERALKVDSNHTKYPKSPKITGFLEIRQQLVPISALNPLWKLFWNYLKLWYK